MGAHNVVFSSMMIYMNSEALFLDNLPGTQMDFYHVYLSNLSIQSTKSSGNPTFEPSPFFESLSPSMLRRREGVRCVVLVQAGVLIFDLFTLNWRLAMDVVSDLLLRSSCLFSPV